MIFKRKSTNLVPNRQPNLTAPNDRISSRTAYYSRRTDTDTNLGRQQNRPITNKRPDNLINYWLQRFGLLVLLIVVLVSVMSALSINNNVHVITLKSSGSSFLRDSDTYQKAISSILGNSIWNRNKVTINTTSVSKQILIKFPELSDVSIVLPILAHRPVVYITASQPTLVITGTNGSYILDQTGKALLLVVDTKTILSLKLPILTDQSGLKLVLGERVLSSNDVSFVKLIIAQLAAKHVVVSGLIMPVASREIDVYISGVEYYVKFNLQDSGKALQQAGSFLATKNLLDSQNVVPSHYIDVRVSGRAYYQ